MWHQIDFGSQSLSAQHAEKETGVLKKSFTKEAEVRPDAGPVGHGEPRNDVPGTIGLPQQF